MEGVWYAGSALENPEKLVVLADADGVGVVISGEGVAIFVR